MVLARVLTKPIPVPVPPLLVSNLMSIFVIGGPVAGVIKYPFPKLWFFRVTLLYIPAHALLAPRLQPAQCGLAAVEVAARFHCVTLGASGYLVNPVVNQISSPLLTAINDDVSYGYTNN